MTITTPDATEAWALARGCLSWVHTYPDPDTGDATGGWRVTDKIGRELAWIDLDPEAIEPVKAATLLIVQASLHASVEALQWVVQEVPDEDVLHGIQYVLEGRLARERATLVDDAIDPDTAPGGYRRTLSEAAASSRGSGQETT